MPLNKKKSIQSSGNEFVHFHRLRAVTIGVAGLLAVGFLLSGYFVYQNIFETIARVHSIMLLTNEYGTEIIDFPAFSRTKEAWDKKQAGATLSVPRDPFYSAVLSAPAIPKPATPATPGANRSL